MKKYIYLFFIATSISCTPSKEEVVLEHIESSYDSISSYMQERAGWGMNLIEQAYVLNTYKVEPFFNKAKKIDFFAKNFYTICDSIKENPSAYSFSYLVEYYQTTIDSINYYGLTKSIEELDLKPMQFQEDVYESKMGLVASLMRSEIAIGEERLLSFIADNVNTIYCGFDTVKINGKGVQVNDNYTLVLESEHFQRFTDKEHRVIKINSIVLNGDLISVKTDVKPNFSFSTIQLDSLTIGNYGISGEAGVITESGRICNYPFTHKFEIK